MRIVVDGMSLLLLSVLPVLLVVMITVQFLLIQLKQTDEFPVTTQRIVREVRHAPGTQSYCHQCQYFAQNRYIVCSLHPGGWPEQEERCTDWKVPEGRKNE
jgi:hypothetical protein